MSELWLRFLFLSTIFTPERTLALKKNASNHPQKPIEPLSRIFRCRGWILNRLRWCSIRSWIMEISWTKILVISCRESQGTVLQQNELTSSLLIHRFQTIVASPENCKLCFFLWSFCVTRRRYYGKPVAYFATFKFLPWLWVTVAIHSKCCASKLTTCFGVSCKHFQATFQVTGGGYLIVRVTWPFLSFCYMFSRLCSFFSPLCSHMRWFSWTYMCTSRAQHLKLFQVACGHHLYLSCPPSLFTSGGPADGGLQLSHCSPPKGARMMAPLISLNMPVCTNRLFSHMFRNTHKHPQLPSEALDKIRVWYELTETPQKT